MMRIFQACTRVIHDRLKEAVRKDEEFDIKPIEVVPTMKVEAKHIPLTRNEQRKELQRKISQKSRQMNNTQKSMKVEKIKTKERPLSQYMVSRKQELITKKESNKLPDTSLVDLKTKVIKGPKKVKKRKFSVKQYDIFSSTSESDNMDEPPKYKTPLQFKSLMNSLNVSKSFKSISPERNSINKLLASQSLLALTPSKSSQQKKVKREEEPIGNMFLNKSFPLKGEDRFSLTLQRTPQPADRKESILKNGNVDSEAYDIRLISSPQLVRDKSHAVQSKLQKSLFRKETEKEPVSSGVKNKRLNYKNRVQMHKSSAVNVERLSFNNGEESEKSVSLSRGQTNYERRQSNHKSVVKQSVSFVEKETPNPDFYVTPFKSTMQRENSLPKSFVSFMQNTESAQKKQLQIKKKFKPGIEIKIHQHLSI